MGINFYLKPVIINMYRLVGFLIFAGKIITKLTFACIHYFQHFHIAHNFL